jgi:hypothetical protein
MYQSSFIPDSLFKEDHLFNTLENRYSYLQGKAVQKTEIDSESLGNQKSKHSCVQKILQKLIVQFQNSQDDDDSWVARMEGFYVLHFLKFNYGIGIMELDKGEKLEEKISLRASSFLLWDKLFAIYKYLIEKKKDGLDSRETQENFFGEEILLIYGFQNILISKNEHLLPNPEMELYVQSDRMINRRKEQTEQIIMDTIKSKKYYFHQKSSNSKKRKHSCILENSQLTKKLHQDLQQNPTL